MQSDPKISKQNNIEKHDNAEKELNHEASKMEQLNKVRHRSIELFSEKQILKQTVKQTENQKKLIEQKNIDLQQIVEEIVTQQEHLIKANEEIKDKNQKLNKALAKARKRTIDLFGKHIELKKAKWYISIINEDIEKQNARLEKALTRAKKRTISLFGKHIDLKKAKRRIEYQSELLQKSYNELEIKNTQINDSIEYARHIQESIIPPIEKIHFYFPDSFIFFKPRDKVSGDFYWSLEKEDYYYLAVVDCTGHGVPGAFMSMIAFTLLNQIVSENVQKSTSDILYELNNEIFKSFYRHKKELDYQNDGMDITFLKYHKKRKKLTISSAGHNYYVIVNNKIQHIKGSIFGIGEVPNDYKDLNYIEKKFDTKKSIQLYMYTDGLPDQFGGEKNKKFHQKRLLYLIENNWSLPMQEQQKLFELAFTQWKGKEHQTDDILLMGINFDKI